jgi:hypothetical protein
VNNARIDSLWRLCFVTSSALLRWPGIHVARSTGGAPTGNTPVSASNA